MMDIYTTASLKRDQLKKFICFHQISYFEYLFLQKVWNKIPTCNLFAIHDYIINIWQDHSLEMDFKTFNIPFRYQASELKNPGLVYSECMELIVQLAELGFIHCDFNEFNLMIRDDDRIMVIDFPQMVSTSHKDAHRYLGI